MEQDRCDKETTINFKMEISKRENYKDRSVLEYF